MRGSSEAAVGSTIPLPCLPGLHLGTEHDCFIAVGPVRFRMAPPAGFAGVLHACKYPCHANATGLPGRGDPRYLACRVSDEHLTLNMIDPPTPLFSVELFQRALDFLDERLAVGPVLIHCNQGLSRAPSIALVYLAKRANSFRDYGIPASYALARADFTATVFPAYAPGAGLVQFLTEHWEEIA